MPVNTGGSPSETGCTPFVHRIASNQQLICPVRGLLNTTKMSKDGLTPTEESYRIEAINYLISMGYPSNAVQVAVLNMLLNGDGKSQIVLKDSLESVNEFKDNYDIITCNPPFGTRIVEKRKKVLCLYDLGYEWAKQTDGTFTKTDNVVDAFTSLLRPGNCLMK